MSGRPALLIVLDRKKPASLQSQLAASLKSLVQSGALRPGKAVPSSRELARDLGVSRNTVIQAYDRLIGEGYLEPSPRRGLFISDVLAGQRLRKAPAPGAPDLQVAQAARAAQAAQAARFGPSDSFGPPVPFRPCQPDVRLFPLALWNRLRSRSLRKQGMNLLHYQSASNLGFPPLRRSLAAYLRESRGVQCDWQQVAITTGSQQALYLLAHLLLRPGSRVAMEDPGYLGARLAWQGAGAVLQPVPVDSEGMRLPPEKRPFAGLVYTTPSRQFPTGACLSLSRRLALIDFAARTRAWIVEDDYDSEFRYSRAPLPSLQSLDAAGRVIYVGSTSKVLFPSLRIGYAVLPAALVEQFSALRAVIDDHGSSIDQAALAEFVETGALYSHIRRGRNEYGRRLQVFLETASKLGLPFSFPHTDGGMNLAGFVEGATQAEGWAARLQRAGLDVPSLSRYSLRQTRPGLVFGFTAFEPRTIREGLKRAAAAGASRRRGAPDIWT